MKNGQSRPTPLEEQAYTEIRQQFAEHLSQFPASRAAIDQFERDISRLALAINMTTARTSPSRVRIQTDDGASWSKSVDLMDNCSACYRPTRTGIEFGVIEQLPSGDHEILVQGRNAVDVLKTFVQEQRKALQLWTEDLSAHVSQFLAEKHPGYDMTRVADTVMRQLSQSVPHYREQSQNRSRGIRI